MICELGFNTFILREQDIMKISYCPAPKNPKKGGALGEK